MTIIEEGQQGCSSILDRHHKLQIPPKKYPHQKAFPADIQEALDREVFSRASDSSLFTDAFMKQLSNQHPHVIFCFIKLATTYKRNYYDKATLQELIEKFTALMNILQQISVAIPDIAKDTPCYDQSGKEWIDGMISALTVASNVDDQVGLLQSLPTKEQMMESLAKKYGCVHYSQFAEISNDQKDWGSLSATKTTAVMMRYLASTKNRLQMGEYASLPELLQNPPYHEEFDETERNRILQNVISCTTHEEAQGTIYAYAQWCLRVKQTLGDEVLDLITNPASFANKKLSIKDVNSMMQCLLEIDEVVDEMKDQLEAFSERDLSFADLCQALDLKKIELYQRKFPEKDIQDVVAAFSDVDLGGVDIAMSKEKVSVLLEKYLKVEEYGKGLKTESLDGLVSIVKEIQGRSAGKSFNADDQLLLLAAGREAIRKKFGIYPYNTQVMATLGLINHPAELKGRIARMLTGEGKSTVITMLSFFLACQGKTIDIISSARYLAKRDQVKYKDFFQAFGVTTSHICTDTPTKKNFDAQILYGTNYDFEFSILRDGLSGEPMRMWHVDGKEVERQADSVIVDESDNLFLDSAMNSARIAVPGSDEHTWIYEPILSFVKSNKAAITHALHHDEKFTKLQLISGKMVQGLRKLQKGRFSEEIAAIKQETFIKWIESAYEALYVHKEKEDYVVKPEEKMTAGGMVVQDEIVIVDKKNTGRLQQKSRWQNGLHQFLEAKHGLPIQAESMMPASLCHPVFFDYYPQIYGLTGTIGTETERQELEKVYTIDTFDVPPHKKNNRKTLNPKFLSTKELHFNALILEAQEMVKQGRPILILMESIRDTIELSERLKQAKLFHQVLNERQAESEDYIIAKAGDPGMITVATNNAGRGTDIILHPESLENGGLHAVMGFYPANDRVERQGFGRAGRQGQPGSCRMIIGMHDAPVQQLVAADASILLMALASPESIFNLLKMAREQRIQQMSHHRQERSEVEKVNHKYLKVFFEDLKRWHAETREELIATLGKKMAIAVRSDAEVDQPSQESELNKIFEHIRKTAGRDEQTEKLATQLIAAIKQTVADSISYNWSKLFYNNLDDLYQSIKRSKSDTDDIVSIYTERIEEVYAKFEQYRQEFLLSGAEGLYAAIYKITGLDLKKEYVEEVPEPVVVTVEVDEPDMGKIPEKDRKYVEYALSGRYHELTSGQKKTTMTRMIKHGLIKCFRKYLEEDRDFVLECVKNHKVSDMYLIHYALEYKQEDVALLLLSLPGFDPTAKGKDGITPIVQTAKYGLSRAFHKILAMPGVNVLEVDKEQQTILMHAAKSGCLEIVKTLCARKDIRKNINAVDKNGYIALENARLANKNRVEIFLEILKVPGVDVNGTAPNRGGRATLLEGLAGTFQYEQNEQMIDALLKMPGINVNNTNGGMNIVMDAAYEGNAPLVEKLRADGRVDINAKDDRGGNTALIWAARLGRTEALKEVLKFDGVDTTAKYLDQTALTICLVNGSWEEATAILKYKGYDVTVNDKASLERVLKSAVSKGDRQTKQEILDSKLVTYQEPAPVRPAPAPAAKKDDGGGGCLVM